MVLAGAVLAATASIASGAAVDARVLGTFRMRATVTTAVNVSGEHRGQVLWRRWTVAPLDCAGSVCQELALDRQRSNHIFDQVLLYRTAPGQYAGSGAFYFGLRCKRRVYPRGGRAPYRIALTVTGAVSVQDVMFASSLTATYVNPRRSDATRCPLGSSHDAARYVGTATAPLPGPPTVSFTVQPSPASETVAFTDTSAPGLGGAPLVAWSWSFGDSASGAADSSSLQDPMHTFSAPGSYQVTLTAIDANGLAASDTQTVTVSAPAPTSPAPSAARSPARGAAGAPARLRRTGTAAGRRR
ncbi:MAG: PKD domain-containing protein [Solirubrobacteraceae bacterium]